MAATALQDRGHRVVFGYRYPVIESYAREAGLVVVRLPLLNDADIYSVFKIIQKMNRENLQIVIPTKVKEYWLAALAAKLSGNKCYLRLGINRPVKAKWKNRFLYGRWAEGIIVNSHSIAATLRQSGFIPSQKIHVIPNGVFAPTELGPFDSTPTPFVFIYIGSLIRRKNLDRLLRLFARLVEIRPQDDMLLKIVGDGNEKEHLIRLAQTLGVKDRIIFEGHCKDVMRLLAEAHAFILISQNEGFPNAVLEAMAAGVPVIISDVAGAGEVISPEEDGLLVDPCDDEAILTAMVQMRESIELRKKLRENAFRKVKQEYSLELMAEKLENLLLGLHHG
ncbi:MAG: glycosyltransferase [Calditrichia bacterium]